MYFGSLIKSEENYKANKDRFWEDRNNSASISKWNLHPDDLKQIDLILENEQEAKTRMLPKETQL